MEFWFELAPILTANGTSGICNENVLGFDEYTNLVFGYVLRVDVETTLLIEWYSFSRLPVSLIWILGIRYAVELARSHC